MNLYVLVEGRSVEPTVYPSWIRFTNPSLSRVLSLADLKQDNFYLFSGRGYPQYLGAIDAAVADLNSNPKLDRLVIGVDSEEMTMAAKFAEIHQRVQAAQPLKDVRIVIQHFCFETWALGNRRVVPRAPASSRLKQLKDHFNVIISDPELLPVLAGEDATRSQVAYEYLRECLREKGLSYNKWNASYVANEKFAFHVNGRLRDTGHVRSFQAFIDAFQ